MNLQHRLRHALVAPLSTLLGGLLAVVVLPAPPAAAVIDDYARYDGQSTCASQVLPGTDFLLRHLVRTNPGTRYVSALRACTSGVSEHKDGRALDWGVDAAVPAQRAIADRFLGQILASDAAGNRHALARRMGIMYVIWNDHIWAAYDGFQRRPYEPCDQASTCSKTLRHRDHVHISLSRSGAAAQTSFYRTRGVPSVPVLYPRTVRLDPVSTALTTFVVPASGRVVSSRFKLVRGTTYRLVADGLYRSGPGSQVADAACRWTDGAWAPAGGVLVNGTNPWAGTCDGRHTHVTYYTPQTTDVLRLRVPDSTPGDNEGAVSVSILREDLPAATVAARRPRSGQEPKAARKPGPSARPLVAETRAVPARAAGGVLTTRSLRRPSRYRVVVTGTARSGSTPFDGACVRYAGAFRAQHSLDLTRPDADHLSVFIQGKRVNLRAPGSRSGCNPRTHRYVGVFQPAVNGRSRIRVWDPYTYGDNTGALTVSLRRL